MPGGHTVRAPSDTRAFVRQIDEKSCGKCLGIGAPLVLAHPESRENEPVAKIRVETNFPGLSWMDNPVEKKLMNWEGAR